MPFPSLEWSLKHTRRFHNYSLGNQLLAMAQCHAREFPLARSALLCTGKKTAGLSARAKRPSCFACRSLVNAALRNTTTKPARMKPSKSDTPGSSTVTTGSSWLRPTAPIYVPEPIPDWNEVQALETLDIKRIDFDLMDGNCQGYAQKRTVAISPLAEHPTRTLLHELAHVVLGHTAERMNDSGELTPRDIRELEAECTAMLVSASLNLPGVEESRGYIQSWYHGNSVPERNAQRIFSAADKILKAGSVVVRMTRNTVKQLIPAVGGARMATLSDVTTNQQQMKGLVPAAADSSMTATAASAEKAREFIRASKAENTLRGYQSDWREFCAWCEGPNNLCPLPASPESVASYIAECAGRLKVGSIQRRLNAITEAHKAVGLESPTSAAMVRNTIKGIRRTIGTASVQKAPTLTDDIRAMVEATAAGNIGARDRALILLGFAGAFRRSELIVPGCRRLHLWQAMASR